MNIKDMTAWEKSSHLMTLCEFEPAIIKGYGACWVNNNYEPVFDVPSGFPLAIEAPNLYDEKNMALAWRVLNWAYINPGEKREFHDKFMRWWDYGIGRTLVSLPPSEAQAEWLDKILGLAIEAGMIE